MKKDNFAKLIIWIVFVITVILCLMVSKWLFELIYNSDMPEWLKYILLK